MWAKAKAASDFALFLPALERNVELRRRYVACFDDAAERYDVLLDEFEPETTTAEVRALFDRLKPQLVGADRRAARPRRRRLVPARRLPGRPPGARSRARSSTCSATAPTAGGSTRPSTRSRPARASTTSGSRPATSPTRSSRSSRRCTSTGTASTTTSCRARSAASRSARPPRSASTSRRAASGRTSSAAASRSGASSIRGCSEVYPEQLAGVELEPVPRRDQPRCSRR